MYRQVFGDISRVSFLKGYDVVVCRSCGFAFADNIPSQDAFDRYYESQSKYDGNRTDPSRQEVMKNGLEFISQFVSDKDSRILEIGCGSGDFLRHLEHNGFSSLSAIEPSKHSVDLLLKETGINAMTGSFLKVGSSSTHDLVILLTVLEHVVDLSRAIRSISNMLRQDGLLFIRVPDVCRFSDFEDSPFQQFSPEHINYFSTITLSNLMGRNGYTLLKCEEISLHETVTTVLPMINLMFRKCDTDNESYPLEMDNRVHPKLKKYIELSAMRDVEVNGRIAELALSQEPILVWGVGTHTLRLLELGPLKNCNIVAFFDSNTHYNGGLFNDIPVHSPEELSRYPYKILISSKVFQDEICSFIRNDLGAPNELVLLY